MGLIWEMVITKMAAIPGSLRVSGWWWWWWVGGGARQGGFRAWEELSLGALMGWGFSEPTRAIAVTKCEGPMRRTAIYVYNSGHGRNH